MSAAPSNRDGVEPTAPVSPTQARSRGVLGLVRWGLFVLFAAIALLEGLLRWTPLGPPAYEPRRFAPSGGVPFAEARSGSITFPIYRSNVEFASVYDPSGDDRHYFGPGGKVVYRINAHGFRGPDRSIAKPPGVFRVLCLGDSLTFGEGVHQPDTYPALLEKMLESKWPGRTVEVINAGVQAYGTREEVSLFFLRGISFKPDVVTLGFYLNDVIPFGQTIQQHEAATKGCPLSGLASLSRICEFFERRRYAASGQAALFEAIHQGFRSEEWILDRELIRTMHDQGRESGFRVVVVILPVLWQLDEGYPFADAHNQVAAACREMGCECVDMLEVFRGHDAASLWVHPTDHHPNERAQRLIAERLAAAIAGR